MKGRPNGVRIPNSESLAFYVGEYLYKNGPTHEEDVLPSIGKLRPREKRAAIQRAILSGWLADIGRGVVDCSTAARAHYDLLGGKLVIKGMGQVAAPRETVSAYERPSLSRKYMLNPRGSREDVPEWSVRPTGFGFKSATGTIVSLEKFVSSHGNSVAE